MPSYAQLSTDSRVVGVSDLGRRGVVDRPDMIEIPEADPDLIGMRWNGIDFEPGPAPGPSPVLTRLAFLSRFTDAELAAIYTAAKSDIGVEIWLDKARAAQDIDLTDARTVDGLAMLVDKDLITQDRADVLLTP